MRYSIVFFLLVGLACSKSEPATSPTGDTPEEASVQPSETARPSIALSAPGAEPRRTLLRTLQGGAKETMKIRSQATMIGLLGGKSDHKTVTPPVVHTLALEVRSVDADGTASVGFEVLGSKVLPDKEADADARAKLEAAASSVRGLKGSYRVDAQGVITAMGMDEPAEDENRDRHMAESIGEFIYQSTVPFPSEAVGKGGKWTVKRRLVEGEVTVDQTSTYELKEIDGSKIVVAVVTEKSAVPDQELPFELEVFAAKGDEQLNADLDRLVPQLVTSTTEARLKMSSLEPGGLSLRRDLTVHTRNRITRP